MARDRQCILCETVHVSKQEMDEHMRSMLHHRELEKLKGRDCGHKCRVCKVTVVSLTDYASHISSPTHKQNVEAAEKKRAGYDHEDYFDQALVDLIEKRKDQIRKEKEAAAAKVAKEEEDQRRKEAFQQRLKDSKERFMHARTWQQPPQRFNGSGQHNSWYRSNRYNARSGELQPWCNNRGKSATWHAQEPPDFQRWDTDDFAGISFDDQEAWNHRAWNQGGYSGNEQCRLPWLSGGGSSNRVYGQHNISHYQHRGRPSNFFGSVPMHPSPPSFFAQPRNQFQSTANNQGGPQGVGPQNGEGQTAESDHSSSKSSKTFGSNPKLDKACRWSPYPVAKGFESVPHKDATPNSSEKSLKVTKPQRQDKAPETSAFTKLPRPEHKPGQLTSSGSVEEKGKGHRTNPEIRSRDTSSSSSRSSSAHREEHQKSASGSSNQKTNNSLLRKDRKMSSVPGLNTAAQTTKASGQMPAPKPAAKQSGLGSKAPPSGLLTSRQARMLPEAFLKVRQIVLEKRGPSDGSGNKKKEAAWASVEGQRIDCAQSQAGVNKENSCRQNTEKPSSPDSLRSDKPALHASDSQFLQSLQVSTSTMEGSESAASSREDEESRKKEEKQTCSAAGAEARQSSESDASRSGDAQAVSGSNTSLSKLDLPPVLKRDLTKHICAKGKTGSHEPNLNIARRVRNLNESRRSDTEKDSGLKPTVRQLISSSGSRRNVNWEQVYQEVRKKQDKGKGMPRFGIEMVPNEQEDQSQEEDDIPLLEGFQWESFTDISATGASRKRSLSESSLAPAPAPSLFTSFMSKDAVQGEGPGSEQQGSSDPPVLVQGSKDCRQEVEQMLGQLEAKAKTQPDKLKALQRSDSVLGDSSSGTEQQPDGQGTGKRRRAAGDVPSAETSCLEHNNKRQKVKSKKERLQVDRLLAVSLREEELSRSLQTVDTSLIQARAALEAAYMEVQRLMVVKQQMTVEMSTLRNKRIELLKGMKGSMEDAPQLTLKEEKMDCVDAALHMSSSVTDTAPAPSPGPPAQRASPPSSSLPFASVAIKQEPQSPVHIGSEQDPPDDAAHCAHSTTPELPVAPAAASPPDPALNFQPSPERRAEQYQTTTEHMWENFGEAVDRKESSSGLAEITQKAEHAARSSPTRVPDSKTATQPLSPSSRGSEAGSVAEFASVPSALHLPASPSELSGGKRVRKLKKRKALKKAQGTEQLESSDTEMDQEPSRPRWLRPRRRPSGGSQVSASSLPTEDREGEMNTESSVEIRRLVSPITRLQKIDYVSLQHQVKLPQAATAELMDSEESMEVTAAGQQPHTDASVSSPAPVQVPDSSRPEPQSLACNEVTSTSDMDICKSAESDMPFSITLPKTSSDISSDHGEDEMPTEGLFEGHQEAVNAMQIHNGLLYTCSGDRTVRAFDLVSHKCVGVFEGHTSKVSCLLVSAAPFLLHRLYSGSSDQTIRCYSLKTQEFECQFSLSDRVFCLHSRWRTLYAGLANGTVVTFNLKTNKQMDAFECRGPRAVSCLASSQEGARRILLVGSFDSTISVRDAKNGLLLRTLEGHTKTVLCMKVVNDLVFSGSSDQCVYTHNIHTGELVRVYKGHSHAVTVVSVLGKVMVTACLDKLVRVYDLQSHEQLQVYGGHKDMVMCMGVHKNMIYTGCYDGSVQAIKLNLMQNYRCRWHGCSLVFGLTEHLQQHLINDHASVNFQTLRCRWKKCEEYFCARNSSKQGMLLHMQKHAEEETELEP